MGYILFSSTEPLSIFLNCPPKVLEYSYDGIQWEKWIATSVINNKIYIRINNYKTTVYFPYLSSRWIINEDKIKLHGNVKPLINVFSTNVQKKCFDCFILDNMTETLQLCDTFVVNQDCKWKFTGHIFFSILPYDSEVFESHRQLGIPICICSC